jgi:DNA-binding transcriptional ArsR family regulator
MPRATTTSDVFNAIAEPRRRQIIELLVRHRVMAVGAVVAAIGLAQPAVSKHLAVLQEVGIVSVVKEGRQRMYQLEADKLRQVHEWTSQFEKLWTNQLDRIKERAERRVAEKRQQHKEPEAT